MYDVGTYNIFLFNDDWRCSPDHLRHRGLWHSSVRERGEAQRTELLAEMGPHPRRR